jgi:hypothetical protein
VLLDVDSWRKLKIEYAKLKTETYGLPAGKEIKWSYLWSIKKHANRNEIIPTDREYSFLNGVQYEKLLRFVGDSCRLLIGCAYCKLIFTLTFNNTSLYQTKESILKMHLQELMQRIEMEIQSDSDNLSIMFFDSENPSTESLLRNAYRLIYTNGDFITEYRHIKDSISFELSHHSFGIQMADYVAGIFHGFLQGYKDSSELFSTFVYQMLRRDKDNGKILGYGIREVPSNAQYREIIEAKFSNLQ